MRFSRILGCKSLFNKFKTLSFETFLNIILYLEFKGLLRLRFWHRTEELGVGVWTKVKFPWLPYRLGCHWNKNFHFLVQMLVFSFFFCIVVPWATKYHTVQPQVNSCDLKRNRLLASVPCPRLARMGFYCKWKDFSVGWNLQLF